VDVDSTICEVCGAHKQGACYGYTRMLPLLYVVVTMAGVQRAMLGTSSAAREAGRVWATADSSEQARARGEQASAEILANFGLDDAARRELRISSFCPGTGGGCSGGFGRGASVTVTVIYRVPVAGFLQPIVGVELPVHATHRTRVDRYRSLTG
jgi:hypothetical protein